MKDLIKLFLPPIIFNALRKYSIYRLRKKKNYDPRRWWEGRKIVKCSNYFKDFFNDFSGKIFTINLQNEIKDCVIIKPFQKKIFIFKKKFDDAYKILIEFGNVEKKIVGNYSVYSNNNKISDIVSPASNEWSRLCIDRKNILSKFEIINNSNQDMYFALPRFIYSKNDSEKIVNIIFLVMDQVDQKFFQSLEQKNSLKNIAKFFKKSINYTNCFAAGDWTITYNGWRKINMVKQNNVINFRKEPYIIAEIGINHNVYLALAKKLIIESKKAGADAVKFLKKCINVFNKKKISNYYVH
jgi:hypothetical protein